MAEESKPAGREGVVAAGALETRLEFVSARTVLLGALRHTPSQRAGRRETEQMPTSPQELSRFELPETEPCRCAHAPADPAAEILRNAEALGIPWKRILVDEIQSERRLRRHVAEIEKTSSLSAILTILASSCLRSWRARDQIERFSRGARKTASPDAVRQLRILFGELTGGSSLSDKEERSGSASTRLSRTY